MCGSPLPCSAALSSTPAATSPCNAWQRPSRVSRRRQTGRGEGGCRRCPCLRRRPPSPRAPACSHHQGAAQQEHGQAAGRLPVPRGAAPPTAAAAPAGRRCATDGRPIPHTPSLALVHEHPGCCNPADPSIAVQRDGRAVVPPTPAPTPLPSPPPRRLPAGARRTRRPSPTPRSFPWASATPPSPSPPSSWRP